MAKSKATERLRAPLMYAFRSAAAEGDAKKKLDLREGGERIIASRRAVATQRRSLSDAALKALLAEDVVSLLNCTNLESSDPELLDGLEHVRKSILNYGLPDLSNRTIDENRVGEIGRELEETLLRYEPRLIARTMSVVRDKTVTDQLKVRFIVRSDMRADPMPTSIEFITEVELDTGEFKIDLP